MHIPRSHTVNWLLDKNSNKTKTLFTIARDPKESITSWAAMDKFLGSDNQRIDQKITDYILLYNFLYSNADYVIDFIDLVSKPDLVIDSVLSLLEINKRGLYQFEPLSLCQTERCFCTYSESSKSFDVYEDIKLDNFNIDLCYFYYNRLLEKKIIV